MDKIAIRHTDQQKEATGSKKRGTLLATSMYRIIGFNGPAKKLLPTCTDLSVPVSQVWTGIDDVSRPSSTMQLSEELDHRTCMHLENKRKVE